MNVSRVVWPYIDIDCAIYLDILIRLLKFKLRLPELICFLLLIDLDVYK